MSIERQARKNEPYSYVQLLYIIRWVVVVPSYVLCVVTTSRHAFFCVMQEQNKRSVSVFERRPEPSVSYAL